MIEGRFGLPAHAGASHEANDTLDMFMNASVDCGLVLQNFIMSEDKARQYSVPERHSFGPYIRAQGFALK